LQIKVGDDRVDQQHDIATALLVEFEENDLVSDLLHVLCVIVGVKRLPRPDVKSIESKTNWSWTDASALRVDFF